MEKQPFPQVFVSYSHDDAELAQQVIGRLVKEGISAFDPHTTFDGGAMLQDQLREGIVGSRAYLLIWTANAAKSGWIAFELGAASAWEKPMFVLVAPTTPPPPVPTDISSVRMFQLSQLDELVVGLKHSQAPLSESETDALRNSYLDIAVPTDKLLTDRASASKLARAFRGRAGRQVAIDILLQELMRLRKQGQLPKLSRPSPK